MNLTINEIKMVKVSEKHFDVDKPYHYDVEHIELYQDAIVTYRTEKGSARKIGKSTTPVSRKKMMSFLKDLYEFVRSAEISCDTIDDSTHEVTFVYGPLHKEVFEGTTVKEGEELIAKIVSFVNDQRKS